MSNKCICFVIFAFALFYSNGLRAQVLNDNVTIQINLRDFESKQALASVLVRTSADSVMTNAAGYFEIKASKRDSIFIRHPGYNAFAMPVRFMGNQSYIYLKKESAIMLQEVEALGSRYKYVMRPQLDTLKTYYRSHKVDTTTKTGADRNYISSIPMGVAGLVSELAAQFSKKEQERRKHLDVVYAEKFEASYWKALDDPLLFEHFRKQYGVDELAFLSYKYYFIQHTNSLKTGYISDQVRTYFFDFYAPYLQVKNN